MIAFEKVCMEHRPDLVLVVGDVNSTLACSIVAKKLFIRVAHGTEELSSHSACLGAREPDPVLFMHTRDAARSGLADNDAVILTTPTGSVAVGLRVVDTMRAGVLVLPRHHRLAWQQLGRGPAAVERQAPDRYKNDEYFTNGG